MTAVATKVRLRVDNHFRGMMPPLTPLQRQGLEDSIIIQGCLYPLIAWQGVLIEGHNRKEICDRRGIQYEVKSIDLPDRAHAELWILQHARNRRNLSEDQQVVLADREAQLRSDIERQARASKGGTAGGVGRAKQDSLSDNATDKLTLKTCSKAKTDTRAAVAKERGVPERKMRLAAQVRKVQPKLLEKVAAGQMTLKEASRTVANDQKREQMRVKAAAAPVIEVSKAWELITGDSIEELPKVAAGSASLVFADPQYNIGIDYGQGAKADLLADEEFAAWCGRWIRGCVKALAPNGSMFVLISDEYADYVGVELRKAGLHRRSWIKWYETFGVNTPRNYNRCSRHLFYCVKDPKRFTWNDGPWNNRPSDRQLKYGDSRANPDGKTWDNVWGINPPIPRLVGTSTERVPGFPTQLPLALVRPIVLTHSNPGDLVLDPFNGSGTTGAACVPEGRRYIGIDKSAEYIGLADLRLSGLHRGVA